MKHIFILNPVAGKGNSEIDILPRILREVKNAEVDYEIHRTINIGDATNYVNNRCLRNKDESFRFYAVGGDGTLNEVANGAYGHNNAEVAFIPAGTGNDFARAFTNYKYFRDIDRQLRGKPKPIDLIKYNDSYLINMMNIGLDCEAAKKASQYKKHMFIKGPFAYLAGVISVFVGNKGFDLTITLEDGKIHQGEFTLVAIGNGSFCGGGFKGVPNARLDDGLLDVSIISKVNRRTFLSLLMNYRKGTHLEAPKSKDIITYVQCRSLVIHPSSIMQICTDGNEVTVSDLVISIVPKAIQFSVPKDCE